MTHPSSGSLPPGPHGEYPVFGRRMAPAVPPDGPPPAAMPPRRATVYLLPRRAPMPPLPSVDALTDLLRERIRRRG